MAFAIGLVVLSPSASAFTHSFTSVTCSTSSAMPLPVPVGTTVNCLASVSGYVPTGTITWATNGIGVFSSTSCTPEPVDLFGDCAVHYTPTAYPPSRVNITATYSGDSNNAGSSGTFTMIVIPSNESTTSTPTYVTFYYSWVIPPLSGPINLTVMLRNEQHAPLTYNGVYLDNVTLAPSLGSTCSFDNTTALQVNQTCWASFTTYGNPKYGVRGYGDYHSMQFHATYMGSPLDTAANFMVAGDACTYYSNGTGKCITLSQPAEVTESTQPTESVLSTPTQGQPITIQVQRMDTLTLSLAIVVAGALIAIGIVLSARVRRNPV